MEVVEAGGEASGRDEQTRSWPGARRLDDGAGDRALAAGGDAEAGGTGEGGVEGEGDLAAGVGGAVEVEGFERGLDLGGGGGGRGLRAGGPSSQSSWKKKRVSRSARSSKKTTSGTRPAGRVAASSTLASLLRV